MPLSYPSVSVGDGNLSEGIRWPKSVLKQRKRSSFIEQIRSFSAAASDERSLIPSATAVLRPESPVLSVCRVGRYLHYILHNLPGKGKDSTVKNIGNLGWGGRVRGRERRGETITQERCATAAPRRDRFARWEDGPTDGWTEGTEDGNRG